MIDTIWLKVDSYGQFVEGPCDILGYDREVLPICGSLGDKLPLYTIYDHPRDVPDFFVVRLFLSSGPTRFAYRVKTLNEARAPLFHLGLVCMPRQKEDSPAIVETWV